MNTMKVFRIALIFIAFFSSVGILQSLVLGDWFRLLANILSTFASIYVYKKTKAMPKGDEWGWALITPTWFMWVLIATFFVNAVDSFMAASTWGLRHETWAVFISGFFGLMWVSAGLLLLYLTVIGFFKEANELKGDKGDA